MKDEAEVQETKEGEAKEVEAKEGEAPKVLLLAFRVWICFLFFGLYLLITGVFIVNADSKDHNGEVLHI